MHPWVKNYTPLFGRILIGGFFVWNGVQNTLHLSSTIEIFALNGAPGAVWFAVLAASIQVLGGIGVVVGFRPRLCAALLAVYVMLVSIFFFDANTAAGTHLFLQRMAIVGGLLYVVAYGSGKWSTDRK